MGWLVVLAAFVVTALLTGGVRRLVLSRGLVDVPNARSSHLEPTARGGGIAIVVVVLSGCGLLILRDGVVTPTALGLLAGGALVAWIGFLDDRGHVPAHLRLLVHVVALGGALAAIGGLPPVPLRSGTVDLGLAGDAMACIACVWFLNLFNFMDGIDGIAASEAAFVSMAAAALSGTTGAPASLVLLWLLVGAASLGFLAWNWPPARIFMGDVGSGFLGFAIALLLVVSTGLSGLSVWTATILIAPFFADATVTLVARIARRERWYSAHRSHAYQWLSRRWGSHARVTWAFILINVILVLPAAWWSSQQPQHAPWVALAVLALLCGAARAAGAGRPEPVTIRPVAAPTQHSASSR
jgi:Fuc2NAc and GlcNAc transferase